jgi:hypothetical protein
VTSELRARRRELRKPPRIGAWSVGFAVMAVAVAGVWSAAFLIRPIGDAARSADAAVLPSPDAASPGAGAPPLPVFALVHGIELRLVSGRTVDVAFHEASSAEALRLRPAGRCTVCRNRAKFRRPRPIDRTQTYIVMDTRGRAHHPTSAADLVLPAGTEVLAPVSGTVTDVRRYRLYGRHPDTRVEIRPDDTRGYRVVSIHLRRVRVEKGDRVEMSETEIGEVRRFPFSSHVDRYVVGGMPHVHLEVKRVASGRPARA